MSKRVPSKIKLGVLDLAEIKAFKEMLELELFQLQQAELNPDFDDFTELVTKQVLITQLYKRMRDKWEDSQDKYKVTISILEAMAIWNIDCIGYDAYTANTYRTIMNRIHKQLV